MFLNTALLVCLSFLQAHVHITLFLLGSQCLHKLTVQCRLGDLRYGLLPLLLELNFFGDLRDGLLLQVHGLLLRFHHLLLALKINI